MTPPLPHTPQPRKVRTEPSKIHDAAVALRRAGYRVWRVGRWNHRVGGNGKRSRVVTDQGLLRIAAEWARAA